MKIFMYFLGGCIALGLIASLFLTSLPPYPAMTRNFLQNIERNDYKGAYALFSPEFKSRYDIFTFIKMLQNSGLARYESLEVVSDVMDNKKMQGYLSGYVQTKDKKRLPIKVDFVYIKASGLFGNRWYIANVQIQTEPPPKSVH